MQFTDSKLSLAFLSLALAIPAQACVTFHTTSTAASPPPTYFAANLTDNNVLVCSITIRQEDIYFTQPLNCLEGYSSSVVMKPASRKGRPLPDEPAGTVNYVYGNFNGSFGTNYNGDWAWDAAVWGC